jgi:hypothetical protein
MTAETLVQDPLAAGGPFAPVPSWSDAAGSDVCPPQQPTAQQESPRPPKINVYRRRPLREHGRPRSFLWHVSRVLAKLSGMVVVSCSLLFIPHIDWRGLRRVGAMLPDPNPDVVHAAASRVKNGFDTLAPTLSSTSQQTFGIGSSKETVLAAQGRPTSARGGIWRYGDSEVYFVGDRVAGWRDSSSNPLMLR